MAVPFHFILLFPSSATFGSFAQLFILSFIHAISIFECLHCAKFWGRYKDASGKEHSNGLKTSKVDEVGAKMPPK